ncbi:MAG: putative transposase [bacterium]|jgi:putative transposase
MTGKSAGFDFGLKTFITPSKGTDINSPLFLKESLKELQKADQSFSSKKKGSNNRKKAKENLARIHIKVANQRQDYHFKLAKNLVEEFDYLFFEDLDIAEMKKSWGRKVSDLGFASFLLILDHQARKSGAVVHKVDRYFPSTKRCNELNHTLTLRDRTWTCECGITHDRDFNAALNLEIEGETSIKAGLVRPLERVASTR